MNKSIKPSPTESGLLFEVGPEPLPETPTALGGAPLVVQAFRSLGLPAWVREQVRIKERQRGYDEATLVKSFAILNAVGGECLDDVRLREDGGLREMVGREIPSASVARKFLYGFHEEATIEEARQRRTGEAPQRFVFVFTPTHGLPPAFHRANGRPQTTMACPTATTAPSEDLQQFPDKP